MKSSAHPFIYRQSPYMDYSPFLQENLDFPFYDFSKIPTTLIIKERSNFGPLWLVFCLEII